MWRSGRANGTGLRTRPYYSMRAMTRGVATPAGMAHHSVPCLFLVAAFPLIASSLESAPVVSLYRSVRAAGALTVYTTFRRQIWIVPVWRGFWIVPVWSFRIVLVWSGFWVVPVWRVWSVGVGARRLGAAIVSWRCGAWSVVVGAWRWVGSLGVWRGVMAVGRCAAVWDWQRSRWCGVQVMR